MVTRKCYHIRMGDLANYSVETDEVVLLIFHDGTRKRVLTSQLERYLTPRDAARIGRALKLRHLFMRLHMPKALAAVAAGSLIAMLTVTTKPLATLWIGDAQSAAETPRPSTIELAQDAKPSNQAGTATKIAGTSATPRPTPGQSRAAKLSSTPTPRPGLVNGIAATAQQTIKLSPAPTPLPVPLPSVLPEPSPTPTPIATPSPVPVLTPGPIANNPNPSPQPGAGQVLGDSTTPKNLLTPLPKS